MTITEIIDRLSQEKEFGSRFPARIIFVDNLNAYNNLVSKLKGFCDITVSLAQFCIAADVAPQFDKLREELAKYKDKQVLLLSVGEYIRMCIKREILPERCQFRGFWELMQPETSKTRYIMPVFCVRALFDRIVGKVDERQEDYVWNLDSGPESRSYSITVYSPHFANTINPDAENLRSWLDNWTTILSKDKPSSVITKLNKYVETSFGIVNIKKIDKPFAYLQDYLLDASALQEEWQPIAFWAELAKYVDKGATFSDVVLEELNVNEFDFVSVAARWNTLTDFAKVLAWLWYRVYSSNDYYSYACNKATLPDEIPTKIRDVIVSLIKPNEEWFEQRLQAVKAFSFSKYDEKYFALLDTLSSPEKKLRLLTYRTHEERAYAIKVISGMLRNGSETEEIAQLIMPDYSLLSAYLTSVSEVDPIVDEYFLWYKKNKLINRFSGEPQIKISFEKYNSRYKYLSKMKGKDCFEFWIDGFGMEWMPVFIHELAKLNIIPDSKNVATAILPTETYNNHQWDTKDPMSEKWNRLDSYSHKGMPDDLSYYSCIDYQLSVFSDAAKHVDELLDKHEYVVITGDHGSSRLAALAFHDSSIKSIAAPPESTVRSYGRICELNDNSEPFIPMHGMELVIKEGSAKYVVMNDYNHFTVGGNVAGGNSDEKDIIGEVHGGNTPEERLVPVIVVKRSHPLLPMSCKVQSKFVTKKNGCVETNLQFNRPVYSLEVSIGGTPALCSENADGTWHVIVNSIPEEELNLTVVANGKLLNDKISMKVKPRGIKKNTDMLGL